MEENKKIKIFEGRKVRTQWDEEKEKWCKNIRIQTVRKTLVRVIDYHIYSRKIIIHHSWSNLSSF